MLRRFSVACSECADAITQLLSEVVFARENPTGARWLGGLLLTTEFSQAGALSARWET
jgi:hypothetical protein